MTLTCCYRPACDDPAALAASSTPRRGPVARVQLPGLRCLPVRRPRLARGPVAWDLVPVAIGILFGAGLGIYMTIARFDALPRRQKEQK